MTDSELNALVAEKVMGREVYQGEFPYDKPVLVVPGSWGFVEGYGSQPEVEDCPDYCNDIAAAWQVVKALQSKNFLVEIMAENAGDYGVGIYGYVDSVERWDEIGSGEDDNSPSRAICLAALEAVKTN